MRWFLKRKRSAGHSIEQLAVCTSKCQKVSGCHSDENQELKCEKPDASHSNYYFPYEIDGASCPFTTSEHGKVVVGQSSIGAI